MQRLLLGDGGSGKTIVAALAALQAIESGYQVAFMAPTEILAKQHYRKLAAWLKGLPLQIAWLSGGLPAKERKKALAAIVGLALIIYAILTRWLPHAVWPFRPPIPGVPFVCALCLPAVPWQRDLLREAPPPFWH